jgi:hypothetical protein
MQKETTRGSKGCCITNQRQHCLLYNRTITSRGSRGFFQNNHVQDRAAGKVCSRTDKSRDTQAVLEQTGPGSVQVAVE